MRDVTMPWVYLSHVPKPPIIPRFRAMLEPAMLFALMLAPLVMPLLTPALFLRIGFLSFLSWLVFVTPLPGGDPRSAGDGARSPGDGGDAADEVSWCLALPQAGVVGRPQPL